MWAESLAAAALPLPQGFDWEALAARRMEPPRKPKTSDHAKRKASSSLCAVCKLPGALHRHFPHCLESP